MTTTYDQACYDLATAFLVDHPEKNTEANRDQLAALIQRTIEDDIEYGMDCAPTVVWLRDVGSAEDECWVPCANGDPGAVSFTQSPQETE
jgi:hypothetical protein